MECQRPIDDDFPKIWYRFQAKDNKSDALVNYVVQDMPENRFEEAVQFMFKNFIPDEPLCSGTDVLLDPVSCKEIADFWLDALNKKMSLVCFKEGCNEIVGMNVLVTGKKNEPHHKFNGAKWNIVYGVFRDVSHQFDTFQFYSVDKYLSAFGLCVHPDFRRRGIASEILKARVPLCKAFDIKVTTTLFTAIGSQISAAKVGFVQNYAIDYVDLPAINADYKFPGVKTKSLKVMSLEID